MTVVVGTPAGASSRRERKRLQTHEALIDAAQRLFLRQGFEATTIEDITEAVDVSARTFFRHFASKEDVVFGDDAEHLAAFRDALDARPTDEPILESVRRTALGFAGVLEEQKERIFVQAKIVASSPGLAARALQLRDDLAATVADYVARRLGVDPNADLRPSLAGHVVFAALGAAVDTWLASGAEGSLGQRVEEALGLLDQGFGL